MSKGKLPLAAATNVAKFKYVHYQLAWIHDKNAKFFLDFKIKLTDRKYI